MTRSYKQMIGLSGHRWFIPLSLDGGGPLYEVDDSRECGFGNKPVPILLNDGSTIHARVWVSNYPACFDDTMSEIAYERIPAKTPEAVRAS